jgi:hypothetical protein
VVGREHILNVDGHSYCPINGALSRSLQCVSSSGHYDDGLYYKGMITAVASIHVLGTEYSVSCSCHATCEKCRDIQFFAIGITELAVPGAMIEIRAIAMAQNV